jgi:ubiquinone/menaquinone biosynthesis C-methylase UbiE
MSRPPPRLASDLDLFRDLFEFRRAHPDVDMKSWGALISADQYRYLHQMARELIPPGSTVLDWGCGNGHFSYFLLGSGHRVSAFSIEPQPPLLRTAKNRFPGRLDFRPGNAMDPVRIPASDGEFDAVCSIGVLEHVRETGGEERRSLRELRRVLKPGGLLLVYHFPNQASWIELCARLLTSQYTHPYRFTRSDVRSLCAREGFEVLSVRTYGALPRNCWRHVRTGLRNHPRVADVFNRVDEVLERMLRPICQNHFFVARAVTSRT